MDTETEDHILNHLKTFKDSCTQVIISHRISSIKHVDQIIVLEDGSICEKGTHEELIQKNGVYYKMYQKQLTDENIIL